MGQKQFRIIGNESGHYFEIGAIVAHTNAPPIPCVSTSGDWYTMAGDDPRQTWYVLPCDLEEIID